MNASLDTISLHVKDIEQSIAFYTRIPGAQLQVHRPHQFAQFRIGAGFVHLVQLPSGAAGFHLEFDTANLNAIRDELRAAGLEPKQPVRHPWGKTDFKLFDPDGNLLEFSTQGDSPM